MRSFFEFYAPTSYLYVQHLIRFRYCGFGLFIVAEEDCFTNRGSWLKVVS